MKKFIPTYHAQSFYDVPASFYLAEGIKTLFVDLDNTLASYRDYMAADDVKAHIKKLQEVGLDLHIISNNNGLRVSSYAHDLGLPFLASARKPFTKRLAAYLLEHKIEKTGVMLVGDQLLTDVACANGLGIKVLLTEKLVKEDQWTTKFNRLIDKPIRWRLRRKNKLKEWSSYDERVN